MIRLQELKLVFGGTEPRTKGRTDERTNGWTDKRGSRNSYLDVMSENSIQINVDFNA